jgi:alpha-beta hydrolase superfamily lysophospholipase
MELCWGLTIKERGKVGAERMNILPSLQSIKRIAIAIMVALAIALLAFVRVEVRAAALPFNPDPLFANSDRFTTTIERDPADIYFPIPAATNPHRDLFPVALLLQGANVDKSNYSLFANTLARYGFVVVVPNHLQKFPPIPALGKDILLPDQHQIIHVLDHMKVENSDRSSPLFGAIALDKLVLVGHSMGGLAGINAIQNNCSFPLCVGGFERPPALAGGVFYGTNLRGHFSKRIRPIANAGIPTALIQGTLDSETKLEDTAVTYQQIQDSPKAFITIAGANHYGIANTNNPTNPTGIPPIQADPIAPTLDQERAIESVARWSALFLRAYVMHDRGALDYLHSPADRDYETAIVD